MNCMDRKYRDKRVVEDRKKSVAELFKRQEEYEAAKRKCYVCGSQENLKTIVIAGKVSAVCELHLRDIVQKLDALAPTEKPFKGLVSEGIPS